MPEKSVGLIILEARVQDQVSPCFGSVPRYKVGVGTHHCKSMWQSQLLTHELASRRNEPRSPNILKGSVPYPKDLLWGFLPMALPPLISQGPYLYHLGTLSFQTQDIDFLFLQLSHGLSWNCPIKQGLIICLLF